MTVTANTTRNDYLAGNNQNVYNYTFQLNDAADVTVILNGVIQTLNVHYTVQNVGVGTGGTITFTLVDSNNDPIFPTQGQQINILMTMELDRDTSYQPNGAFLASDVNNDYDRLWLAENQQQTAINRSLRLQDKDATSGSMELPLKASRLNRMLAFDSVTGEPIAGPDVTSVTEGLTLSATLINGNNTNGNDIVFNDNDKAKFGTGSDLEIYHDGNNSIIKESGTGAFYILNSSNERMLTTTNSGAIELYHSDDIKLSTTANGVDVTGAITVSGNVDGRNISADGIKLDGIEALADVTDTDNVTTAGALMDSEITNLAQVKAFDSSDYATAAQGTTADSALPKSGGVMTGAITTNSTFDGRDVATDGTKLDGIEASADVTDATNVTAAGALMDSEVTNLAQVKAFSSSDYATAAQGTTADNALPKSGGTLTGDLNLGASDKVVFNTNFEIYRDASNAIISETGAGSLILRGTNLSLQSDDNDQYLQAIENGGVTLYHQTGGASSPKVSTTNSGIDVTGTVKFDGLEGTNSVNVTQVLDEDSMSSNSATSLSTQQSIKSYVDTAIAGVPQGDITGVTAGTNLSGGGTSGAVTLDLDNNISLQNITLTGYLRGPSNFTIDPAAHGDDTGTLVVAGNLQVDGTTTTINSTTVEIADLNFKVAKNATSNAEANTGGFTVGGSNAELKYLSSGDKWTMNKDLDVSGSVTADSLNISGTSNLGSVDIYDSGSNAVVAADSGHALQLRGRSGQNVNVYAHGALNTVFNSTGIDVTGTVTADGLVVATGGTAIEFNHSATGPTLRFNNTDQTVADGQQLARMEFSTDDAGITTDVAYLQLTGNGTGGAAFFDIMTGSGALTKTARFADNGDISFYEDTGTTPKMVWSAANEDLNFADNVKATFGAGDDLEIYHDGSHSYISDQGTGQLRILASQFQIMNAAGTESMVFGAQNNTATLYYDNAAKLATTSTGIDVTGSVTANSGGGNASLGSHLDLGDNQKAKFGASDDLEIYHDGSNSIIKDSGTGILRYTSSNASTAGVVFEIENTDSTNLSGSFIHFKDSLGITPAKIGAYANELYIMRGSNNDRILTTNSGAAELYYSDDEKLATTSTGIDVTGTATMDGLTVGSASGVFPSEVLQIRGNGGTSGYINGFGLGASNSQLRVFADDTNNTLGSIKFDIRNRDRILIEDNGDISFYEDTGTTAKLFWDASAESLGIGNSGPQAGVHITQDNTQLILAGAAGTNDKFIAFDVDLDADIDTHFITVDQADALAFGEKLNDNDRVIENEWMRITNAGNVGIGTSSPATALHVDSGAGNIAATFESTDAGSYINLIDSASGTYGAMIGAAGDDIVFSPNNVEAMRIDSSGNVILAAGTGTLQTATAGTSNFRAGVNAGNSIQSGGNYNVVVGDEAGTAITTGDNNVAVGTNALDANTTASNNTAVGRNALGANTTGQKNIGIGSSSLSSNTTASHNVAIGYDALESTLTGTQNTAIGSQALRDNTANNNVAVGMNSLLLNTTGTSNTAVGTTSLDANTTGDSNSAIGYNALTANTTGGANTAVGKDALKSNATASNNTAVGYQSQESNTTGSNNSSLGLHALRVNTTGIRNTAVGGSSLDANTTGSELTAVGWNALGKNTSAAYNTAVGCRALNDNTSGTNNTAVGQNALLSNTTGTHNTSIGSLSGDVVSTGTNNCFIGYNARASGGGTNNANVIGYNVIGETGYTTLGASGADIRAANGNVTWATVSDERYKKDIVDSTAGLSFINALQPRTFKYKTLGELPETFSAYEADSTEVFKNANTNHGFIAQEVKAAIDADSSIADGFKLWDDREDGSQEVAETALIPILVKAIQELTARIETLEG